MVAKMKPIAATAPSNRGTEPATAANNPSPRRSRREASSNRKPTPHRSDNSVRSITAKNPSASMTSPRTWLRATPLFGLRDAAVQHPGQHRRKSGYDSGLHAIVQPAHSPRQNGHHQEGQSGKAGNSVPTPAARPESPHQPSKQQQMNAARGRPEPDLLKPKAAAETPAGSRTKGSMLHNPDARRHR